MRWAPGSSDRNVEDRRGQGMGMAPMGIGGAVVMLILGLIFGPGVFNNSGTSTTQGTAPGDVAPVQQSPQEAREVQLVTFVLDTSQITWSELLPKSYGVAWHDAKLALFRDATRTGCGVGQTAMGPFYCPEDQHIYIDLSFYDELRSRFGAPGEFAEAYVITHELGHHVQHLLGTDEQVRRAQQANPGQANALSVKLELQADCYSGVWAYYANQEGIVEPGDIQSGLTAAAAVGDDRIQQATTGHVNTDTFTHGSSRQRMTWFKRGFDSGDPKACDTFGAATLSP